MPGIPPFMPGGKPGFPFVPPMMAGKGVPPVPGLFPWMFPYKGGMPFPNVPGLSSQVVAQAAANVAAAAKQAQAGQYPLAAQHAPAVAAMRQSAEERATASASLLELLGGGQFRKEGKGPGEPQSNGFAPAAEAKRNRKDKKQKQVPLVDPAVYAAESANAASVPPSPPKPDKTVLAQMSQLLGVAPQATEPTVYQFNPGSSTTTGEKPAVPGGFTSSFRHYTREEITKICADIKEIAKPDSYGLLSKAQLTLDPPNGKFEEAQNWDDIPAAPVAAPKKKPVKKQTKEKAEESKQSAEKDGQEWKKWFATGKKSGNDEYTAEQWAQWEASEAKKSKKKGAGKAASAAPAPKKETTPKEPAMKWVAKPK